MRLISSSTLSNQNISSSTLLGTYTADAPRELFVRLFADQVNGGANYLAFLTLQRAGAGTAYTVVPKTSASVDTTASGICLVTIAVPVSNTDVVKVYLTGASDDTTTPDTIAEVWETLGSSALGASNFAASTIDKTIFALAAASQIWDAGVRTVTGLGASTITANTFAASAIDKDAIALTGGSQIWNAAVRTITGMSASVIGASQFAASAVDAVAFAQGAADKVWTSGTRTLTQSGGQVAQAVAGSAITVKRGDSWSISITGLGNLASRTKFWFTAKRSYDDADADAIVQIEESASLIYIGGSAATASQGGITVNTASTGDITIRVDEAATKLLTPEYDLLYDVQSLISGDVTTEIEGPFSVQGDVTKAAS